ncbi:MAG: peptidoglycan DD-metalloendopeptidase family protein [Patescibacteria group bacterium]
MKHKKRKALENGSIAHFVVRSTAVFIAITIIGGPLLANADVFSFMSKALGDSSEVSTQNVAIPQNTQKMPLLQAPTNANPLPKKETQDVSMVDDGTALSNENDAIDVRVTSTSTDSGEYRPSSDQISLYTVHKGDTLQQIAQMFGVTSNTILWANDLKKGQAIVPGQVLVILPISGIRYVVKKGDTLKGIAKAFKGDADDISRYNGLDDSSLAVGDEIIIPNGESSIQESKPSSSSKVAKGGFATAIGGSIADPKGYFTRPVSGGIRTQGIHGHNGVDIASSYGTPILAAASGTVVISRSSGWNGGYGNYVVIQHSNGMQTLYGHMSRVNVSVGEQVSKGQTIGGMGNTGQSTGVHLHFEVRGGKNPF